MRALKMPGILVCIYLLAGSCINKENNEMVPVQNEKSETLERSADTDTAAGESGSVTENNFASEEILKILKERSLPDSHFLEGDLYYALQEDGTDDKLWRMIKFEEKLIYDMTNGTAYIQVQDKQEPQFGIMFPQELKKNAHGWEDEEGFPYTQVIDLNSKRYVSIRQIAEKNEAWIFHTNGFGDVHYFPKSLVEFMETNYYANAAFKDGAWREIYLTRKRK